MRRDKPRRGIKLMYATRETGYQLSPYFNNVSFFFGSPNVIERPMFHSRDRKGGKKTINVINRRGKDIVARKDKSPPPVSTLTDRPRLIATPNNSRNLFHFSTRQLAVRDVIIQWRSRALINFLNPMRCN